MYSILSAIKSIMKQSLKIFTFLLFILSAAQLSAQFDNTKSNNKASKIKAVVKTNTKVIEKTKSIELNSNSGFKKAYDEETLKLRKKQAEEDFKNKGILTREQLNNMRVTEMYGKRTIKKVDSHQGDFLTRSKTVTISFRDFGAIDGDVIAIFHNDVELVSRTTLNHHYQSYQLDLEDGNNKIEIIALNQGSLGANTAQYKLVDNSGIKIASKYWFLATGARAIFNVTKDK